MRVKASRLPGANASPRNSHSREGRRWPPTRTGSSYDYGAKMQRALCLASCFWLRGFVALGL